ncbi:hypothetical protein H6G33_20805 [Calothrix sp. FACHB-1219]|uniref:hypothetical protein n=1 Tax=unclassified Calothrix TaxID=2619626 RepID=UPI001689B391|nr:MULTISPECIES: hypothetical protein [unclassified Calothrix]MBD2206374.1 hypothetical protein [Calothrix sp. FACHB-168]MBD2219459.1 hypothetical protein [Calothrix sp. FACHB-1219]
MTVSIRVIFFLSGYERYQHLSLSLLSLSLKFILGIGVFIDYFWHFLNLSLLVATTNKMFLPTTYALAKAVLIAEEAPFLKEVVFKLNLSNKSLGIKINCKKNIKICLVILGIFCVDLLKILY